MPTLTAHRRRALSDTTALMNISAAALGSRRSEDDGQQLPVSSFVNGYFGRAGSGAFSLAPDPPWAEESILPPGGADSQRRPAEAGPAEAGAPTGLRLGRCRPRLRGVCGGAGSVSLMHTAAGLLSLLLLELSLALSLSLAALSLALSLALLLVSLSQR